MTKRVLPLIAAIAVVSYVCVSVQAHDIWTEDFAAAKSRAEKENKDLLLEFTGSDWCPYCIKLHKEVFELSDFKTKAPQSFVLVELDFPQTKHQSDAVKAQNQELQERYGIDGFPTVLLTDAHGVPYARLGYNPNGVAMTDHMIELHNRRLAREEIFAKAKLATGVERARLLDQGISGLDKDEFVSNFDDILEQIVAADADNKAGLKAKYATRVELRPIIKIAQEGDVDGAVNKLEQILKEKDASAARKQEVLYMKAILLQFKSDRAGSVAALRAAHDLDPASERGKEITGILKEIDEN